MFMYLYSHHWKSFIRNGRWRRNLFSKIMYGVMIFYIILAFNMLGSSIVRILAKTGENPTDTFNSFLIWYLAIDLLMRCLLQPLPTIQVIPYLSLRIRRSTIINYLLFRSLWNIFNFIPWLIIIPFSLKVLFPAYGIWATTAYLAGFFFLIILNNYFAVLIGYLSQKKVVYFIIPFSILALIAALEKTSFSIRNSSLVFGQFLVHGNVLVYAVLLMPIIMVLIITRRLLLSGFYIDEISSKKESGTTSGIIRLDAFGKFGEIGRYLSLEINLLIRNKRPRQMLIMLPIFVPYFLFITSRGKHTHNQSMPLLMISIVIGIGVAIYGQFMFSWESAYFDGIMARKNNFVNYVKAKYYLMMTLALILFIPIFITFSITGRIDLVLLFSIFLFTLGVTCFIVIFFGTFNDGRIDLSQSKFFNYQGAQGRQFFQGLIYYLLPISIYYLIKYLINDTAGKLAIAILGIIFIIFHDWWIRKIIVPRFYARKYKNLEGYRNLTI
jgi:hypothetical protein